MGDGKMSLDKKMLFLFWWFFIIFTAGSFYVGCKTLDVLKRESRLIEKQFVDEVDTLSSELIKEYSAKIRKELARGRARLTDKIRKEIARAGLKLGIRTRLRKPLTQEEKRRAQAYVSEMMKTSHAREIVNPEKPDPNKAYKYTPSGRWEPSEELKKSFFKRSPRAKTAREELQILMMAVFKLKDILITEANRSCAKQKEYCQKGVSKICECVGMHNKNPSWAIDFVPMKGKTALWNDRQEFAYTIGLAQALYCSLSKQYGWSTGFRSGADWKRKNEIADKGFIDLPHIEIRNDIANKCSYEN